MRPHPGPKREPRQPLRRAATRGAVGARQVSGLSFAQRLLKHKEFGRMCSGRRTPLQSIYFLAYWQYHRARLRELSI